MKGKEWGLAGVLDTKGYCFLCLDKILTGLTDPLDQKLNQDDIRRASSNMYSLHCLSRYLGMSITMANANDPDNLINKSRLKVTLCSGCGSLSDQFTTKYEQLHKIQMELLSSLERIHEKLVLAVGTGKTKQFRKLMTGLKSKAGGGLLTGTKENKEQLKFIVGLRQEAMRNCAKLNQLPPRVKVLSMSAKQIKSAKKLIRQKPKAVRTSSSTPPMKDGGHGTSTSKTTGNLTDEYDIGDDDVHLGTSLATSVCDGYYDDGDMTSDDVYENEGHRKKTTKTSSAVGLDAPLIPKSMSPNPEDSDLRQILDDKYDDRQRKMFKVTSKLFGSSFKPPTKQEILKRKHEFLKKNGVGHGDTTLQRRKRRSTESGDNKLRNTETNVHLKKDIGQIDQLKKVKKVPVKLVKTPSSSPRGRPTKRKRAGNGKLNQLPSQYGFESVVFDIDSQKYKCHLCPRKAFSSPRFLRRHYQNDHSVTGHDKCKPGNDNCASVAHTGVGSKLQDLSPHNISNNRDKQQDHELPLSSSTILAYLRADQDFEIADITKVKVEPCSSEDVNYESFDASEPDLPPQPPPSDEIDLQIEIGEIKLEPGIANVIVDNGDDSDNDMDEDYYPNPNPIKISPYASGYLSKAKKSNDKTATAISKICAPIPNTNILRCRLCPMIFKTTWNALKHFSSQHKAKLGQYKRLKTRVKNGKHLKSKSQLPKQRTKPNDKKPSEGPQEGDQTNGHSKTNKLSFFKVIANSIVKSRSETLPDPVDKDVTPTTGTVDADISPEPNLTSSAKLDKCRNADAVKKSNSERQEETQTASNISQKPFTKNPRTGQYNCSFCSSSAFTNYQECQMHINTVHEKDKFRCKVCPLMFEKHSQLHQHVNSEHQKRYTCNLCAKEFRNKFKFNYHRKSVHQDFKCESCGKFFNMKCILLQHQITTGCGVLPKHDHSCSHCGNSFAVFEELQEHWKTVHFTGVGGEFGCDLCGKMFMWAKPLTSHKENFHGNVKQKSSES